MNTLEILFFVLLFIVFYTYVGYGILLWILVKVKQSFLFFYDTDEPEQETCRNGNNTALPEIAKDFKVSPLNMQLAAISYTLTVALLIPLSGYLVDRFGTKNVFFGSIGIFMLGLALCAAAANLPMLVMARVIQGIGGAMLVPVPRLTILRVYDKSQLLNAINYAVMPALIGPIFGPLVGG